MCFIKSVSQPVRRSFPAEIGLGRDGYNSVCAAPGRSIIVFSYTTSIDITHPTIVVYCSPPGGRGALVVGHDGWLILERRGSGEVLERIADVRPVKKRKQGRTA